MTAARIYAPTGAKIPPLALSILCDEVPLFVPEEYYHIPIFHSRIFSSLFFPLLISDSLLPLISRETGARILSPSTLHSLPPEVSHGGDASRVFGTRLKIRAVLIAPFRDLLACPFHHRFPPIARGMRENSRG